MVDYLIGFFILFGYLSVGFILIRLIRKWTISLNMYLKLIILSLSYASIFGIGIVGGGGEPGFAWPCPIIVAGLFDIWIWIEIKYFFNGIIIPLIFWWTLIFVVMLVIKKRREIKKINILIK